MRNVSLDMFKVLLACMVVGIHGFFLVDVSPLLAFLTEDGLFRIAVPIFFMINGYYFHTVCDEGRARRWFVRIGILYAFWMLFYAYFWSGQIHRTLDLLAILFVGYWHLWYLAGALGAAAMLLMLKRFRERYVILLMLLLFATGVAIQYLGNYHVFEGSAADTWFNRLPVHRNFLFFAFPFFYLGYLFRRHDLKDRLSFAAVATGAAAGLLLLGAESLLNFYAPAREGGFDNYAALLIAAPALFLLVVKTPIVGNSRTLALLANGIYFIHVLVIIVLGKIMIAEGLTFTLITLFLSVIAAMLLVRIHRRTGYIL